MEEGRKESGVGGGRGQHIGPARRGREGWTHLHVDAVGASRLKDESDAFGRGDGEVHVHAGSGYHLDVDTDTYTISPTCIINLWIRSQWEQKAVCSCAAIRLYNLLDSKINK